jgi:hypothetical protein
MRELLKLMTYQNQRWWEPYFPIPEKKFLLFSRRKTFSVLNLKYRLEEEAETLSAATPFLIQLTQQKVLC